MGWFLPLYELNAWIRLFKKPVCLPRVKHFHSIKKANEICLKFFVNEQVSSFYLYFSFQNRNQKPGFRDYRASIYIHFCELKNQRDCSNLPIDNWKITARRASIKFILAISYFSPLVGCFHALAAE